MSIILICTSLIVIFIAIVILVLHFLKIIKPVSESGNTSTAFWIFKLLLLIFLIQIIVGSCVMFNNKEKKFMKEKSIKKTFLVVTSLLEKSENQLSRITFKTWNMKNFTILKRLDPITSEMVSWATKADPFIKELKRQIDIAQEIKDFAIKNKKGDNCIGYTSYEVVLRAPEPVSNGIISTTVNVEKIAKGCYQNMMSMIPELQNQTKIQEKLYIRDKKKIENHLKAMKDFLAQSKPQLESYETLKHKYREQVYITFTRQTNIKYVINITFGVLITLAVLTSLDVLFSLNKCIGVSIWSIGITLIFFFAILLTIINASIIAAICFGFVGSFECPFNEDNFGFANFTSSNGTDNSSTIVGNTSLPFCTTSNITFFSSHKTGPSITKQSIREFLQIQKYTKTMVDILTNPTKLSKIDMTEIGKGRGEVQELCEKLYELIGCNPHRDYRFFEERRQILVTHNGIFHQMRDTFLEYNVNMTNVRNFVAPKVDRIYVEYVEYVEKKENEYRLIKKKLDLSDFDCKTIYDAFSKIGKDICEEVAIPIEESWIHLLLTMISCIFYLFIHILVYRCCKARKAKEDIAVSQTVSPCSLSPISPQLKKDKEVRKNEGKMATTPTTLTA